MHRIAWIGLKARGSKGASFTWRLRTSGRGRPRQAIASLNQLRCSTSITGFSALIAPYAARAQQQPCNVEGYQSAHYSAHIFCCDSCNFSCSAIYRKVAIRNPLLVVPLKALRRRNPRPAARYSDPKAETVPRPSREFSPKKSQRSGRKLSAEIAPTKNRGCTTNSPRFPTQLTTIFDRTIALPRKITATSSRRKIYKIYRDRS
jgi:hypothetical protein